MVPIPAKAGETSTSEGDAELGDTTDDSSLTVPTKRSKVKALASRVKAKVKDVPKIVLARVDPDPDPVDSRDELRLSDDPAFDPALVLTRKPPKGRKGSGGALVDQLKGAGEAALHPQRALRAKATRVTANKISESQKPYLTAEQDLELLRANEDLIKASPSTSSVGVDGDSDSNGEAESALNRLKNIEANRASIKTAWAIGRHVARVRAVQKPRRKPLRQDYVQNNAAENQQRFEWEKWLAQLAIWYTRDFMSQYVDDFDDLPFDVQDVARTVERLAMVSAPWQAFLMDVRHVYTWRDKRRTAKWALVFWTLWYIEHIMAFVYGYIIYMTVRNRFYPSSVESMRDTMRRTQDRQVQARAWGELIEKHGRTEWIEPLLQDLGPIIQMQLGDLANFVEVLVNFYGWERPRKTAATLFFFLSCLALTLLADIRYCVKVVWFLIGGSFFVTWPLAVRFPKYRFVVNVLRWIFWDIPTHAELGIIQLQEKTIIADAQNLSSRSTRSNKKTSLGESDSEYASAFEDVTDAVRAEQNVQDFSFRAYRGKSKGQLHVLRTGLRFDTGTEKIEIDFSTLIEMRKVQITSKYDRLLSFRGESKGLEIDYRVGLDGPKDLLPLILRRSDRLKIFNYVLAWSGLKWQALQLDRHGSTRNIQKQVEQALDPTLD